MLQFQKDDSELLIKVSNLNTLIFRLLVHGLIKHKNSELIKPKENLKFIKVPILLSHFSCLWIIMDSSKALYVQRLQYLQNIQVINHKYKICEL